MYFQKMINVFLLFRGYGISSPGNINKSAQISFNMLDKTIKIHGTGNISIWFVLIKHFTNCVIVQLDTQNEFNTC